MRGDGEKILAHADRVLKPLEEQAVFKRNGDLGRQELEHPDALSREGVRRQLVLEVKRAEQRLLSLNREHQSRSGFVIRKIRIGHANWVLRDVINHEDLARRAHVLDDLKWQLA